MTRFFRSTPPSSGAKASLHFKLSLQMFRLFGREGDVIPRRSRQTPASSDGNTRGSCTYRSCRNRPVVRLPPPDPCWWSQNSAAHPTFLLALVANSWKKRYVLQDVQQFLCKFRDPVRNLIQKPSSSMRKFHPARFFTLLGGPVKRPPLLVTKQFHSPQGAFPGIARLLHSTELASPVLPGCCGSNRGPGELLPVPPSPETGSIEDVVRQIRAGTCLDFAIASRMPEKHPGPEDGTGRSILSAVEVSLAYVSSRCNSQFAKQTRRLPKVLGIAWAASKSHKKKCLHELMGM